MAKTSYQEYLYFIWLYEIQNISKATVIQIYYDYFLDDGL